MDAKVIWKTGLSFTGTSDSGFTLPMGSKSETGTPNNGFRPVELLAIGLAGCTAMDVISILEKKKEKVSAFEVTVHAVRANEHPKVFTQQSLSSILPVRISIPWQSKEQLNFPAQNIVRHLPCSGKLFPSQPGTKLLKRTRLSNSPFIFEPFYRKIHRRPLIE